MTTTITNYKFLNLIAAEDFKIMMIANLHSSRHPIINNHKNVILVLLNVPMIILMMHDASLDSEQERNKKNFLKQIFNF